MPHDTPPPDLLRELAETTTNAESYAAALERAVSLVCDASPWVYIEVWEPDESGEALTLSPVWSGSHDGIETLRAASEGISFLPGEGLPGRVWETGEVEWVRDVAGADPETYLRTRHASDVGLGAAVAVPVIDGGVVAVLVFYLDEARAESTELVVLASSVAADLSAAYLRGENERLDEFVSIVSHDLRNPLGVARGYLTLAQGEMESSHLDGVGAALDRMDALIEDLLHLARQGCPTATELVPLADAARNAWAQFDHRGATLEIRDDLTVLADRARLEELLENLLSNAVRHGGPDVTVVVGTLDDGFYVEDDGPGVADVHGETVFEPGYTTHEEGTGFGLAVVKRIATAHGWRVGLGDCEDGCRVEITGMSRNDLTGSGPGR